MYPAQLLELNLATFQAVVDGYTERLLDAHTNAVWIGYYSGYYQSKRPKSPSQIIEKLQRKSATSSPAHVDTDMDAEIERFKNLDTAFYLAQQGGETNGG